MARYIGLHKLTQQGVSNIKGSPARLEENKPKLESMGVKIIDYYYVTGQYDAIVIVFAATDHRQRPADY